MPVGRLLVGCAVRVKPKESEVVAVNPRRGRPPTGQKSRRTYYGPGRPRIVDAAEVDRARAAWRARLLAERK